MKNTKIVLKESISLVDEIFRNKNRKNSVGIITTGIGLTITVFGINILLSKPNTVETVKQKHMENSVESNEADDIKKKN